MSAWIVTRDHIDLIITAALSWEAAVPEQADMLGQMLWRENAASVAYRHPDNPNSDPSGPATFRDRDAATYTFTPYPGRVDPDVVAIACDSLAFQSCEHPDWQGSQAKAWLMRLIRVASDHSGEYAARYGRIDPERQPAGRRDWYWTTNLNGTRTVASTDAWAVHDRDTFHRATALRAAPTTAAPPRPYQRPSTEPDRP